MRRAVKRRRDGGHRLETTERTGAGYHQGAPLAGLTESLSHVATALLGAA